MTIVKNVLLLFMVKFEILEHVTDLKIRAFGKDKKELFLNSMIGMYKGGRYQGENSKLKRKIKVSSPDLNSLLVDFLSEVLYLTEVKKEVYQEIKFQKFNDQNLEGILIGQKLKRMGVLIKGVTYHGLNIQQRKDGIWQATILFDI